MHDVFERKDLDIALPYESDVGKSDREIAEGLMEITALSLSDALIDESAYE